MEKWHDLFDDLVFKRDLYAYLNDPEVQKYKLIKPNCEMNIIINSEYIICEYIKAKEEQKGYGSNMMDTVEELSKCLKKGVLCTHIQKEHIINGFLKEVIIRYR